MIRNSPLFKPSTIDYVSKALFLTLFLHNKLLKLFLLLDGT